MSISVPAQKPPAPKSRLQPSTISSVAQLHLYAACELQHGHHRVAEYLANKAEEQRERRALEVAQ